MKPTIGLLVAVAACGGAAASDAPARVAPAAPETAKAPDRATAPEGTTALVSEGAALRWQRDGQSIGVTGGRAEAAVVARDGDDVQLRFGDDDLELALWTEQATLSPVMVRATAVRVGGVVGPELFAGAPIRVRGRPAGPVRAHRRAVGA
jgi:hypothetical protein